MTNCKFSGANPGDAVTLTVTDATCMTCGYVTTLEMMRFIYSGHRHTRGIIADALIPPEGHSCDECGEIIPIVHIPCGGSRFGMDVSQANEALTMPVFIVSEATE
jgi:hypothetical protein